MNLGLGNIFGGGGSGMFGWGIGRLINDITGTSDSARQQYEYNSKLQDWAAYYNRIEAEKTREFNAQQAEIERNWQENMSNTAHQRAVADLKAAGINPVLAAGAEASSNAGATAVGAQATAPGASTGAGTASANPIDIVKTLVSTINSAKKTNAEIKKIDTEIKNIKADTSNKTQEHDINEPDEETSKALKWWNSTWPGKALSVAGQTMSQLSPFINAATDISKANSARRISKSKRFKQ